MDKDKLEKVFGVYVSVGVVIVGIIIALAMFIK